MSSEIHDGGSGAGAVSLASILNILWRRRWIVVGLPLLGLIAGIVYGQVVAPLYLATATIRPGITAFDSRGGGNREWRLKDLTRWYDSGMYRYWTARRLERPVSKVPPIRANFIQRGLQNIQGGNVVTLTVMDASPENAALSLEASIEGFVDYAMSDSLSNSIVLTRWGLQIQIDELRRYRNVLDARVDSLNADLAVARVESLSIDQEVARLDYDARMLESRFVRDRTHRAALEVQLAEIDGSRQELKRARELVAGRLGSSTSASGTVGVLTDAAVLQGIVSSAADLEDDRVRVLASVDSLEQIILASEQEAKLFESRRLSTIANERATTGRLMANLRAARDVRVPSAIESVDLRIREKIGQLKALSPIEKIGAVEVSDDPVRPRKSRAVTILVFLGIVGGVVGAYVFDYVWSNRTRIFQS